MNLPNDPVILLSYVNTQLRDNFKDLNDLCKYFDASIQELSEKLQKIEYYYDEKLNCFVRRK